MGEQTFIPTDAAILPFTVGERVAFREDHPEHGAKAADGELVERAKYGVVTAIGLLEDGTPAFDVAVFDPHHGAPAVPAAEGEEPNIVYRATLAEIQ